MKKGLIALLSALFIFAMAGCGNPSGPTDSSVLLNRAKSVQDKIKSYSVTTTTTMDVSGKNKNDKTTATTVLQVQKQPFAAHMTRSLKTKSGSTEMMDVYMTKDAVYVKGPKTQNKWTKMAKPNSDIEGIFESSSGDLKKEYHTVSDYTNNLALDENGKNWVASFTGKGKEFDSFSYKIARSQLPNSADLNQYINNVTKNDIYYYYSFNKETNFPTQMELHMSMDVGDPQSPPHTLKVEFHTVSNFSQFNKVNVTVPSNVKSGM